MSHERAGSLIFLFVGIYGFIFSLKLPLGKLNEPGAGMIPLGISVLLILSGVFWFAHGKMKGGEDKTTVSWRDFGKKLGTPATIVGITGAAILLLQRAGYLITAALYIFLLLHWVSRLKFWVSLGSALLIGLGTWYFFDKILAVQLPAGLMPF